MSDFPRTTITAQLRMLLQLSTMITEKRILDWMMTEYVSGGQKLIKYYFRQEYTSTIQKCKAAAWKCTKCDSCVCVESLSSKTNQNPNFFASVKASSVCIHLSWLVGIQSVVHGIRSHLFYGHKQCSLPEVSITSFLPLQFFVSVRLSESNFLTHIKMWAKLKCCIFSK